MEASAYPNLLRRYLAAVIDLIAVILIVVAMGKLGLFEGRNDLGALVFLLVLVNYEPILTKFLCTAGQAAMSFRVRDVANGGRAPIWRLYIRVVVKAVLGIVSFLTLPVRRDRRAIHDLVANTLVVEASSAK
jgi:uncharacterized RDD family membrane protein YckC